MSSSRKSSSEKDGLDRIERRLKNLQKQLTEEKKRTRSLEKRLETRTRREGVIMDALRITSRTKKGEGGLVEDLNEALIRLEEYMLRTSERIDNILSALKSHRDFLMKMNSRLNKTGTKEKILLELDIMRNTLWILGLNGVKVDASLVKDIEALKRDAEEDSAQANELRTRKDSIDKKFDDELKRVDLEKVSFRVEDIPGYL